MKLLQALEVLKRPIADSATTREILLECGFTPLHFKSFFEAHLRICFPQNKIEIKTGLYGDLAGNLERLQPSVGSAVCIVIEWADFDRRLGIRSLGSWRPSDLPDILESARRQSERLAHLIKDLAEKVPVYISTPTLPLPPIFITRSNQSDNTECKLREMIAGLSISLSSSSQIKLVSHQRLGELSPLCDRFDPKSEISSGFPFSLEHASKLAELFATLIRDAPPKKGLITDLDDTLWAGVLGEVGIDGVSWDMASGAHLHGLYQRFLGSLAGAGVLLAVASKNDHALAERALARNDILVHKDDFFPLEIHWGPKSESVRRILGEWNIAPEDVVFIDDSPMEVAEVESCFPQMECIVFPKNDHRAIWELLKRLRDSFGKSGLSPEDEIRLRSIRSSATFRDSAPAPGIQTDRFLRNAEATLSFSLKPNAKDRRAFELINKTNQFNLNGRRLSQSEWLSCLQDPGTFLLTATYDDKYGPLGKIAVIVGKNGGSKLYVSFWVMSCRAFSRRIEHQCLTYLFEKMAVDEIVFDYRPTLRNGPVQDFFAALLEVPASPNLSIKRASFVAKAPALFHRVIEVVDA